MRFGHAQLVTNGSMSTGFFTNGIDLQQEWGYSVQVSWTSTSSASQAGLGTIKLQVSDDNVVVNNLATGSVNPAANVVNWCDLSGTLNSTSLQTGTSQMTLNIYPSVNRWMRAAFVAASGTGVMNIQYFGKGS